MRTSPTFLVNLYDLPEPGMTGSDRTGIPVGNRSWHREESQDLAHDAIALIGQKKKLSVRGAIQND